jgi:C1A family cysteine protease
MSESNERLGMGWLPDFPDFRDYTEKHEEIGNILSTAKVSKKAAKLPSSVDLRAWCSRVEDQGSLGSCTAHAGVGIVEYYEKRAFGKYIDASRLFLYKVTRNLLHWKGDTGAFLRSTMGALVLFGVPPEEYHPYGIPDFDEEPTAFCYAFAQNYQTIKYFRHDPPGTSKDLLLERIRTYASTGHPSMFGFTVYSSISQATKTGKIPFPCKGEKILGGHAVAVVGYDDKIKITNTGSCKAETTGALLIRNSWGTAWGESGYGWLPYKYVLEGLAEDFWSILKKEWIDTKEFAGWTGYS